MSNRAQVDGNGAGSVGDSGDFDLSNALRDEGSMHAIRRFSDGPLWDPFRSRDKFALEGAVSEGGNQSLVEFTRASG